MKRPTRLAFLGVWLGAAVVQAQAPPQTAPGTASTSEQPAAPTGPQVQAEIVSIDAAAKTLTVRESAAGEAADAAATAGSPATLPVEGAAITRLGLIKAGDRVTLICAGPIVSASSGSAPATGVASDATTGPSSSKSTAASSEESTSGAAGTAPAPDASVDATASGKSTASAPATSAPEGASPTGLNATCGSVVEIAKARPTTPQ